MKVDGILGDSMLWLSSWSHLIEMIGEVSPAVRCLMLNMKHILARFCPCVCREYVFVEFSITK